jgi:uncharacterized protein
MTKAALEFTKADRIGRVAAVDTTTVLIDVEDSALVTRVGVGHLIAIQGSTQQEFLIGLTERITRSLKEEMLSSDGEDKESLQLAPSPEDLVRVVLVGTYHTVHGSKSNTFKRGADGSPQIERDCYLVEGANLQRFMGLLGADLKEDERLQIGRFVIDPEARVIANGDKFFQRHAAILGSTGAGKSWLVALVLERASALKFPNLVVLDMHGEYAPLCNAKDGFAEPFRIAGPGDLDKPSKSALFLPYWLLNHEEMLSMILDRSDQNAPNQASRFTSHVRDLKDKTLVSEKQAEVRKTFTVDSPIPYDIADLVKVLEADDTRKGVGATGGAVKGDWEGKLTRFLSRLKAKLDDRRYGFMFQPPKEARSYGWLAEQLGRLLLSEKGNKGVKVIDFSEVPSDILPVVTGTFARLLYDIQFWLRPEKRTPFALVCDEAHLYLPTRDDAGAVEKQALRTFERIAKEGRKYGVSLLIVSQRPSDVSRTILSQCNNFLVLRLTNDTDQSVVRQLMPESMAGLTQLLPLLDTGEALVLGDAVLLPTRVRLDKPKIAPASSTRDFWQEWNNRQPDSKAVQEAVESMRSQTRPAK